jgi:outer membrane lipoprotein-sorting protein
MNKRWKRWIGGLTITAAAMGSSLGAAAQEAPAQKAPIQEAPDQEAPNHEAKTQEAAKAPPASLTLEELLRRNLEARGGAEAWQAVKTLAVTGAMTMGERKAALKLTYQRPLHFRFETELDGEKTVQAYDGEVGWVIPPYSDGGAIEVAQEALPALAEQADFEGPLIDHEKKGHTLTLAGRETFDGKEAYRLRLVNARGEESNIFLDAETYLELGQTLERTIQGQKAKIETHLRDYRPAGSLLFPRTIEQNISLAPAPQIITFDSVEVNPEVEDGVFAFPEG